jgi:CMP-2-keto-3-deoxyoctulosonic acid synthetase
MKKKDQLRKEMTKKKYEEQKKQEFKQIHTFQPNQHKIRKRKEKSMSTISKTIDFGDSAIDLENLGRDSLDKTSKANKDIEIKQTENAFLERMNNYTKQKLEKEKKLEQLRIEKEEQEILNKCTFQPNKNK